MHETDFQRIRAENAAGTAAYLIKVFNQIIVSKAGFDPAQQESGEKDCERCGEKWASMKPIIR